MTTTSQNAHPLSNVIRTHETQIAEDWMRNMKQSNIRSDGMSDDQLRRQCAQFLTALADATRDGNLDDIDARSFEELRHVLGEISTARARQGSSPSETATFVFSLKQALFAYLGREITDPKQFADLSWNVGTLLDKLGLFTIELYQKTRDQIIVRQQQELLELSTPVVKLWHDVLALPLIGTLDSSRTQVVMESLLQKIVETGAAIAIIDITGVPMVDTLVAQHLLKTIAAARLMGADCIISGIRPQIAQTIVHLGVNLEDVITKATLADAFLIALQRAGATISIQGKA